VEVSINGPFRDARTRFEVEAGEPVPKWLTMWPWFS